MPTPVWFKNVTVFNLDKYPELTTAELEAALAGHTFTPCGSLDKEQFGFTPVFGQTDLVRKTEDVYWVEVKFEQKVVPGAIVKRMLTERVIKLEAEEARKVGKKEKKEMKESLIDELLAKALATQSSVVAMIDPTKKYIFVNSTSTKKTDTILSLFLHSLDGLEISRLAFDNSIATNMADLLVNDEASLFKTESSLLLKGPGSPAASVRFAKHDLQKPEVLAHLKAGLRVAEMELSYNERIGFVLTEPFSIKRMNFTDQVQDELGDDPDNADEMLDGILVLQTGELRELVSDLRTWLQKEAETK